MMGFDETIIRFDEGWELHLNSKQGATIDFQVDGIGKGSVIKVETQIKARQVPLSEAASKYKQCSDCW